MWDLSSLIRDRACAPAVEAWSLNHRTTGETPLTFLLWVCAFIGSQGKKGNSRKTSASLTMLKPLTVWITTNCGKIFKRWEYQTT